MNSLLASSLPALEQLCRTHGVRSLYLFGSAARPDFDAYRSDLDFVVDFADNDLGPWMRRFFIFRSELQALLQRPVDLHLASALGGSRIGAVVDSTKVPIYAAA